MIKANAIATERVRAMSTASRRQEGVAFGCSGEAETSAIWIMHPCRTGPSISSSVFVSGQSRNVSGQDRQPPQAAATASAPLIGANRALSSGRTFSAGAKRLR